MILMLVPSKLETEKTGISRWKGKLPVDDDLAPHEWEQELGHAKDKNGRTPHASNIGR